MAIAGGILLLVGLVLFFVRRTQLNRLACIRLARLSNARDLRELAAEVAQEIGAGSWQDYIKVQGKIECDRPLRSQEKQAECVYYHSKVVREYEEVVTRKDDSGRTIRETQRRSETIAQQKEAVPFQIADATGAVTVDPSEAEIETVSILSEFRPAQSKGALRLGREFCGPGKTLGFRYEESILPLGRAALVIGMACDGKAFQGDRPQSVTICKPTETGQKFIISLKAEGELAHTAATRAKQAYYGMLACLGAGTLLLVMGVV